MQISQVSLATLGAGAALERFDYELKKVLQNIADGNTKATASRSITLTVTIDPDESRERAEVDIKVSSKLAPMKPESTRIFINKRNDEVVATEFNPNQQGFDFPSTGVN